MKKAYKPSVEETIKIREKMKTTKTKNMYRQLEAFALLDEGKTSTEVSKLEQFKKAAKSGQV